MSPSETEDERLDRKLIELLNELRVALPGVQVLFAFLLTLPFSSGFAKITDLQRDVYLVALVAATVSSMLLIAPSAYHRIRFKRLDNETTAGRREMLLAQDRLAIAGMGFLVAAMTLSLFVAIDVLVGSLAAFGISVGLAIAFAWLWFALPLTRRRRDPTQ